MEKGSPEYTQARSCARFLSVAYHNLDRAAYLNAVRAVGEGRPDSLCWATVEAQRDMLITFLSEVNREEMEEEAAAAYARRYKGGVGVHERYTKKTGYTWTKLDAASIRNRRGIEKGIGYMTKRKKEGVYEENRGIGYITKQNKKKKGYMDDCPKREEEAGCCGGGRRDYERWGCGFDVVSHEVGPKVREAAQHRRPVARPTPRQPRDPTRRMKGKGYGDGCDGAGERQCGFAAGSMWYRGWA
ncbi:hypothetical protein C8J57DRAFT_1554944 [Mycena rebaudengoi]|nr:hypothetical protein C8J57DRAFT_1554944 [Mycena rebaudengoi]